MNTEREKWLAKRRHAIGGSEIATLLGISKWSTPYDLWRDKTGRPLLQERDAGAEERMHWGSVLEDIVAREYAARTDTRVQRINGFLFHPKFKMLAANVDRAVVAPGSNARWNGRLGKITGATHLLECKTAHALAGAGGEWGQPGTAEVPEAYWLQCQWYLGITGLSRADLAVLFGGQRFEIYTIPADPARIESLFAQAQEWWMRHVIGDSPPPPQSESEARQQFNAAPGLLAHASDDVAEAAHVIADARAQIKQQEQREQAARDILCCAMRDAEAITHNGQVIATWRQNKASAKTDWRAVAHACSADAGLVAAHTTTSPGARVLKIMEPK